MAYRITAGDGTVEYALRRIADEQIGRALAELARDGTDLDTRVHQVRKRCKKLRGLLRLVRPGFGGYGRENAAFREAARAISTLRDTGALIDSYDAVTGHFGAGIDRRAFAPIRARLTREARRMRENPDTAERIADVASELSAARQRAAHWTLDKNGFDAVSGGLGKTYGRARKRMEEAWAAPDVETMHAWRKRVKYHWYHARLLRSANPAMMEPHLSAMDRLSDLLGDHHDLAVLGARLDEGAEDFGPATDVKAFRALVAHRMGALEAAAFSSGRLVLAERRKALVKRWKGYWRDGDVGPCDASLLVKA